jgi:hypothetical protein
LQLMAKCGLLLDLVLAGTFLQGDLGRLARLDMKT